MRCGVVARKLGMSRIFSDDGEHIPVTVLKIEDVEVLAIKSNDKDGYTAVQLGFANKKPKNIAEELINQVFSSYFIRVNSQLYYKSVRIVYENIGKLFIYL